MYRLWSERLRFGWDKSIGYSSRRLALLDWLDANVEMIAFADADEAVGVTVHREDLQVTVDRTGMTIANGPSGDTMDPLRPVIEAILGHVGPRAITPTYALATSSFALSAASYHEACAALAERTAIRSGSVPGWRSVDTSVLADVVSDDMHAQIEWGIVERDELRDRLSQRVVGRIRRAGPHPHSLIETQGLDLPELALFAETFLSPSLDAFASDAATVFERAVDWRRSVRMLIEGLHASHMMSNKESA